MLKRKRFRFMIVLVIMLSLVLQSTAFGMSPIVDVNQDAVADFFAHAIAEAQNSEVNISEMETDEQDTEEVESEIVTIVPDSEDYLDVEATLESEEGIYVFFNEQELLQIIQQSAVLPPALAQARIAAQEALIAWNETTDWGAAGGNATEIRASAMAAVVSAIPANVNVEWIGQPLVELGGVNIFDGPFFSGILQLTYLSAAGIPYITIIRSSFVCDRRIEWNSTYYDNRNMFPEDGIARSDMERNMFELENNFGTSRAWGSPNIARVANHLESEFLDMGFARENVEIVRVDRRNRGLNPDGSPVAPSAIPWIGRLVFDIPGEANPNIGTYDHYGTMHYGGMTLPGNEVHVAPEDWPFEAITDVTLVDVGTFPILNIPEGTSGDVMVAVRFVEANFNVTTQLAPAIDALMIANPDVNIVGAVVARTGRVAWQRGVATVGGGATSPYPVILSSCMNLDKLIERGEDLQSFELVRRTHNYGVVATIPADVGEGEDPDMIIVVTAHMDSSGLNSPGASDNSSGTVVAVDMGRHLIELTNEDGVIPGNRIEIQLAPVGAHEGGGGTVSVEIAHRIIARGLGGITINMNMDMVMSPSAMANGTLMDAVSMDTWMPANVPGGDAGLRFNLPAYLVIGSITGVAGEVRDPVLADGIVNARIFRFGGSEHVRFNEAPRSIEAASLIIVEDTTGQNNIGTFYHNAMDSMEFEYCYDRLSMSRDLYVRGVLRAIEQEITKRGEFTFVGDELILENSSQLFQTFDRVAGDIVIEGTSIPFVINYPDTSVTIVYPDTLINQDSLEEVPDVVVRNVMASGYGVADHRNTARLENHPHLNRFSTGLVANLNEFCLYDLKEAILYAVANFDPEYDWTAGTVAARQPTATGVIWDAINGEGLTNEEIGVAWIATPVREGANITAPGIYAGVVRVTYLRTGATIYVPITFESAPQTSWIAPPEYVNRNQVPVVDGVRVPRSPLERNTVNLVDRYGQRLWGTPNEYAATRYAEQAFLDAGLEPENVSVMTFNRAELGATAGQRASGFAGRLEFVGEFPDIYGNALPNSAAFPVLDDPTIVDLGTFPNITVPAGISGDIVVAMRTDMVQLQVETHLAPVLLALEEEHDVNIEAVLLARNGDRNLWQANIVMAAQLPGIANVTNPGHEGSPFFPMILLTDYHLEMALERGAQLNLIERYERTDVAAVHAVLPASTDTPDMVIVLTAHMDGVTAAPSVSDNGASVAALIEMARYFVDYDRGNIEIHFLANGGHEVGGMGGLPGGGIIPSLPVQWKIAELEEANLDVVTINMDFNMVVSPMADPQGNPLDALSVGVLNRPVNVDRVDFNLSAHLLLDHASTLWAPGIVNARISNFSGADSEDFTDAGIDAASLAVRGDLTEGMAGGLGREIWYHTAFDNLDRNYCYNRLNMSANVMREALRQAFDQETTRRAEFGVNTAGELVLVNAEQMFQTYDRVEGSLIFEDNVHVFTFERSVGSALVLPGVMLDNLEYLEFGAVVASGYGNPDHNPRRPARNAQWMLDNARFSTSMVPSLSTDIIIPPPDRGDLGDIIDEADLLDREDFTAANWRLFVAAFAHAQNVYDNPEATQAEIDFAIATLRNIMNRAIGG